MSENIEQKLEDFASGSFWNFVKVITDRKAYMNTAFLLLMCVMGFVYFLYFAIGLSIGFSTISLLIGIPLLAVFMLGFVLVAKFQNYLAKELLGLKMAKFRVRKKKGLLKSLGRTFTNARLYSTALYAFLSIPMGQVYLFAASILFGIAMALILIPVLGLVESILTLNPDMFILFWIQPFATGAGIIVFACALHLGNLFANLHKKMSKQMLIRGSA